jgi:DNA (cytosine-5)-methyltransferase 1
MANKNENFTIVDLFSGVGGLSLGFQNEGFDLLFANDNDHNASETFRLNHPNVNFFEGDVKELNNKKLNQFIKGKKINVLVGGVPCQSFSMKGKRIINSNREDPRDFLFKEFMRVTKILNPEIAIIENVKGLLSSHDGAIRDAILEEFSKMGYKADFKVLNAADFGVAQLRERVVFIANRINAKNIFPEPTHLPNEYVGVMEVLRNLPPHNHEPKKLSGKVLERVRLIKPGQNWKFLPKELQTGSTHSGAYGRLDPKKPSMTLTTRFDTPPGGYVTHPVEDRAITVREGARIQSFPDDFIFTGNRISQYKQVGNAVPVKLSEALAKSVIKMLKEKNES